MAAFLLSQAALRADRTAGPPKCGVIPPLPSPGSGHGQLQVMPLPGLLPAPAHVRRAGPQGESGTQALAPKVISKNRGDISSSHARKP